jgi:hypothetical protein
MSTRLGRAGAAILGAWCAACVGDSTAPGPRLAVSPGDHALSVRADSVLPVADSALVVIAGADAASAPWVASHGAAAWLTLTTAGGVGSGYVRWRLDTAGVSYDTLPRVFSDTIAVALGTPDRAEARVAVSLTIRPAGPRYLAVRRAWRPRERDSLIAFILAAGAWGEFSDVAAQAVPAWDSTTDVVVTTAGQPAAFPTPGVARGGLFQSGWGAAGLQTLVVFDSIPGDPATRDSLQWMQTLWWDPADATWHGFIVDAPDTLLAGFRTVKTSTFDASGGHNGLAAGEARLASGTYWEGSNGGWKVARNSYSGAWTQITSGAYLGGDIQSSGLMGGNMKNIRMPRLLGTDTPATQNFDFDYTAAPINSSRIRCYFPPITPPAGFHQCTGTAAAAIVAAARAGRVDARAAAGILERPLPAAPPRRRPPARRRRRVALRFGPLLALFRMSPSGGRP